MADPAYVTHAARMARRTRGNIRDFCARTVKGLAASDLNATDSTILNRAINDEQEEWRSQFPGIKGFGERISTETWTADDTRHELPMDFGELIGSRIILCDTDGNESGQLEVIHRTGYDQEWNESDNRYDSRDDPIAYLFGHSDTGGNDRRLIEIRPSPSTAIQFKIPYYAFLENLDADADVLEAPVGMHGGIESGCAAKFALFTGSPKADALRGEANRVRKLFLHPTLDERKRPGRFRAFTEPSVQGYSAFEFAE